MKARKNYYRSVMRQTRDTEKESV